MRWWGYQVEQLWKWECEKKEGKGKDGESIGMDGV